MSLVRAFIILFSVATAVAITVRRTPVPYTVALVIVGLVLGSFRVIEPPHLTKELLFAVFLPGLLFEAAFNLDAGDAVAASIVRLRPRSRIVDPRRAQWRNAEWPTPGCLRLPHHRRQT